MEQIKYEACFGDQSLFDGAKDHHVFACKKDNGEKYFHEKSILSAGGVTVYGDIAMRRIISTPVWTMADKEARRLPEVGCKVLGLFDEEAEIKAENDGLFCVQHKSGKICLLNINELAPIETTKEKAKRLRDKWINKAYGETAVFGGVTQDENNRLKTHLGNIYDVLLSGELKIPQWVE